MLARVSSIETFRRWRNDEDASMDDLIAAITDHEPTPAMLAGTAFHAGLEAATEGESGVMIVGDYRFNLHIDIEIALPRQREIRARKNYGPLTVTGKFDALDGLTIIDHKTTARFDAEKYIAGCQWKFYLDIFGCNVFRWNVFEIREADTDDPAIRVYDVFGFHPLEQMRYPGLHDDCLQLALEFHDTVSSILPDYQSQLEAA